MPIGKKIYSVLSKKERRSKPVKPKKPATVNQFEKNQATHAKPMNVHITDVVKQTRNIGPNEGKPVVNELSVDETQKKAVKKPKTKRKSVDPGDAQLNKSKVKSAQKKKVTKKKTRTKRRTTK